MLKPKFKFINNFLDRITKPGKSLQQIRVSILDRLYMIASIVGLPAILMAVFEAYHYNQYVPMLVYIIVYLPVLYLTIRLKESTYKIKASVLLMAIYIIASQNFFTWGVSGASIPLFVLFNILVSVFYGMKKGLISISLSLIPLSIACYLMCAGYLEPNIGIIDLSNNLISWITAASVLIFISAISVISSGILQTNLVTSIDFIKKQAEELRIKNRRLNEDINKIKKTEEALKKSKNRFRRLFEDLGDAVFVTSLESDNIGQILEANLEAEKQTGYSRDELLSMNIIQDITIERDDIGPLEIKSSMLNGKKIELIEKKAQKDGTEYWTEVTITPIDYKGRTASLSINHDITERILAEQEKEELQKQLLQTQKLESVGTLAGGVAHDFNNILTVIMGLSEMLLKQTDEENFRYAHLENIHNSSKRAARLTRQLLLFSRKQDMELEIVNINEIIDSLHKMLTRLIDENISMHLDFDEDIWQIKADRNQMEQVITNLVVNARDAMPDGGELTIYTKNVNIDKEKAKTIPGLEAGKYIRLSIEDTGVGIDKDIQNKIFDPFFTTKGRTEGTGMGLSVVHGIIKEHGGIINVYSETGEGTIFKIYLLAINEQKQNSGLENNSENFEDYKGNGECILIVEDEKNVLSYLENILGDSGYDYLSANNGEDAIRIFKEKKQSIDLLISDVIMTGIDGIELAEILKQKQKDLKVILSSGYSSKKIAKSKIKEKGFQFIQKPYDILDLLKKVYTTIN